MNKLKKKKQTYLLNYQSFLKKNKLKLRQNLFENKILLKNSDNILIEYYNNKNLFLPISDLNLNENQKILYTIQTEYNNNFLFNYYFNYFILYHFTKLIFQNKYKKNKKIQGRIINGNKEEIVLTFFGILLSMKPKNLHKNKKLYYSKKFKKVKILLRYKMKSLIFNVEYLKRPFLSRKTYVEEIIEKQNFKFENKILNLKDKFKKKLKKKKHATI